MSLRAATYTHSVQKPSNLACLKRIERPFNALQRPKKNESLHRLIVLTGIFDPLQVLTLQLLNLSKNLLFTGF